MPLNVGRGTWHPWQGEAFPDQHFAHVYMRAEE